MNTFANDGSEDPIYPNSIRFMDNDEPQIDRLELIESLASLLFARNHTFELPGFADLDEKYQNEWAELLDEQIEECEAMLDATAGRA